MNNETEIKPRYVNGEPICNPECAYYTDEPKMHRGIGMCEHRSKWVTPLESLCVPGIQRDRNEAQDIVIAMWNEWSWLFDYPEDHMSVALQKRLRILRTVHALRKEWAE